MNRKVKQNLAWELVTVLKTHIFFHRWKLQEKSTFVYIDFFNLLIIVLLCKAMLVRYQLFITYMLCYCL